MEVPSHTVCRWTYHAAPLNRLTGHYFPNHVPHSGQRMHRGSHACKQLQHSQRLVCWQRRDHPPVEGLTPLQLRHIHPERDLRPPSPLSNGRLHDPLGFPNNVQPGSSWPAPGFPPALPLLLGQPALGHRLGGRRGRLSSPCSLRWRSIFETAGQRRTCSAALPLQISGLVQAYGQAPNHRACSAPVCSVKCLLSPAIHRQPQGVCRPSAH
jgi:hypothetical protein